jgi:nucleotide-binding universal stress UspA family protein
MNDMCTSPSVVVGIDGSRSALDAALWAVDEAVSRDIPLRLVYAIAPDDPQHRRDAGDGARKLAAAETAVRHAFTAIESTDKPVKIEVEILQERPARALLTASRRAAMVCVGSVGLRDSQHGRIGSTAIALASSAHCPVAVIRGHAPVQGKGDWVVVELTESPAGDRALRRGLDEARLRGAPLRVLSTWQSTFTDVRDGDALARCNRMAKAQLDRRLMVWRKRYPDLDVHAVGLHGTILSYLAKNSDSIQLLVVDHERGRGIGELVGPPGYATLAGANCSLLICEPQNVL